MSKTILVPILAIFVLLLSACMPIQDPAASQVEAAATPPPMVLEKRSDVPRISLEEAKQHFDNGTAIFVDSRSASEFEREHIAGAVHLQTGTVDSLGNELPKDRLIIAYCTWMNEASSASLAFQLNKDGYPQVNALLGGMNPWREAGYPMEGAEQ